MANVYRYSEDRRLEWEDLVRHSSNGTFLHSRSYLDYHQNRFVDHSLMVYLEGKLVGGLVAHEILDTIYSHLGLTYGGIILHLKLSSKQIYAIVAAVLKYLSEGGFETLILKHLPSIYAPYGQGILEHCYFLVGAELVSREYVSAIKLPMDMDTWAHGRRWALKKAEKANLRVEEAYEMDGFWEKVLIPNLQEKFGANPVHSNEEISYLARHNPGHIRQYNVLMEAKIVAGITIFETPQVVRTQYISATLLGKSLHALDLLIYHLGTQVFCDKEYIDMGTSHEVQGRKIKHSLLYWKESFGALPYLQDTYQIQTSSYAYLGDL